MPLRDSLAGAVVFAFAATIFILAGQYSSAVAFFPRAVAGIMMACAALLAVRGYLHPSEGETLSAESRMRISLAIALTFAFIVGVDYIGFTTASLIFIPCTAYIFGVRNIVFLIVATIVFSAAISILFRNIFGVRLPPELILQMFG